MRYISRLQQKMAHAFMKEIGLNSEFAEFSEAVSSQELKIIFDHYKHLFSEAMDYDDNTPFSLKKDKCTVKQFRAFWDFLTAIALWLGMDTKYPLVVEQYIELCCVKCIENKICCVTGEPNAEIHFVDKPVRDSYALWDVTLYRRMALSPSLHKEIEEIGYQDFCEKYLICVPVKCKYHPNDIDIYDRK